MRFRFRSAKHMKEVIMSNIHIGAVYQSNGNGSFIVLEKCESDNYRIKFIDTGTVKKVREHCIVQGCVRDQYRRNVCGVACTGNAKTKGANKQYYSVWHDMICRCYDTKNKRHLAYKNVTVCDRWLVFENFLSDVKLMNDFDEELFSRGELVLDKDIKQRFLEHKVYSPETCSWVSKHENNRVQDGQQKIFYAMSPDGEVYKEYNITDFARKHNLDRRHISGCLHGRTKTHRGWKFSYEEIV